MGTYKWVQTTRVYLLQKLVGNQNTIIMLHANTYINTYRLDSYDALICQEQHLTITHTPKIDAYTYIKDKSLARKTKKK